MICTACRSGGELNRIGYHRDESSRRMVKSWHDKCKGGTRCDCQHKIGIWINGQAEIPDPPG